MKPSQETIVIQVKKLQQKMNMICILIPLLKIMIKKMM